MENQELQKISFINKHENPNPDSNGKGVVRKLWKCWWAHILRYYWAIKWINEIHINSTVFWLPLYYESPYRGFHVCINFRPNIYEVNPDLLEILYPIKRSPRPDFGTGRGLSGVDYSINANGVIHLYKALGKKMCTYEI